MLAARLHDVLPNAVKLEALDNLAQDRQTYFAKGPAGPAARDVERELLRDAERVWARHSVVPPILIVCARFGSPDLRRLARDRASALGMRFLLAEANASTIRSLRRVSRLLLPAADTVRRVERYELAQQSYRPVSAAECARLPALALRSVLTDLERATERVTGAWLAG